MGKDSCVDSDNSFGVSLDEGMVERFDPIERIEAMRQVPRPLGACKNGDESIHVYYPQGCCEKVLRTAGAVHVYRENGCMVAQVRLNRNGPTWIGNGGEGIWRGIVCRVDFYFGRGCRDDYFGSVAIEHEECLGGCMTKVFVPTH